MEAIVWTKYGPPDGLQLQEVEKPTPKENEVLIKVYATTVTAGDCEIRSLKFPLLLRLPLRLYNGLRKPKRITILGQELAGEIEDVGKDSKLFKKGDPVFAATDIRFGAYAQYICLSEEGEGVLARRPANMSYEEATTIPVGGLNALYFLRKGNIQSGQKVLINGAGGSIGTIAIQLAKYFGAEVTAVDSAPKLAMMRSIGADHVIDYTQEDFTENGETYDLILDIVGKSPFSRSVRALTPNGYYLLAIPTLSKSVRGRWVSMTSSKKVISGSADYKNENLTFLKNLVEAGKIKSVIDRRYPLEQIPEAHRYVETGKKKGNVVIAIKT
jgi:NADPH:quinone reductase-like Zn-dependent oxidoreductase